MSDLPRRDIPPLYPRPGRLEETLHRARRRRARNTGFAALALVLICGGGVAGAVVTAGQGGSEPVAAPPTAPSSGQRAVTVLSLV